MTKNTRKIGNEAGTTTAEAPALTKAQKARIANEKAKAKKEARLASLVYHPALVPQTKVNKDGVDETLPTVKLEATPEDYSREIQKPLEMVNFKTRAAWYLFSATQHEARAIELRKMAADMKSGKTKEPSVKKFDILSKRLDELSDALGPELAKSGIDLATLQAKLAELSALAAAKATPVVAEGNGQPATPATTGQAA